jgi:hypothetical protein
MRPRLTAAAVLCRVYRPTVAFGPPGKNTCQDLLVYVPTHGLHSTLLQTVAIQANTLFFIDFILRRMVRDRVFWPAWKPGIAQLFLLLLPLLFLLQEFPVGLCLQR